MTSSKAQWSDFSEFLVHFTKGTSRGTAHDNIMSITWERCLRAGNSFGVAKQRAPPSVSQEAVCFSEIPLHEIGRLASRRGSHYGIGFSKDFISEKGGCPVWYVPKDGPTAKAIQTVMFNALKQPAPESEPIWRVTPLIDFPGDYPKGPYRFEWEREWRFPGNLQFVESDVAFLVMPEQDHSVAREFFESHISEGTGPGYICPYIDPFWDRERVQKAFRAG